MIAFFDMFDYPLTSFEIWKWLTEKIDFTNITELLDNEAASNMPIIAYQRGLYFLKGRNEITEIRQQRHNYSLRKIRIARRFVKIFQIWSAVKMIALANSIGQNNLRDGSDIDFFIVTSPHRLWLTRLYCTGLAKILNSRPRIDNKRDKICLSFYLSADYLNIDSLRLAGQDPYFDYWRRTLVVLYNKNNTYEGFCLANNSSRSESEILPQAVDSRNLVGDCFEKFAKKIQLAIMPPELLAAMNNSDGVVINDSMLKLYLRDRRREFAEKYGNKIHEIFKESN